MKLLPGAQTKIANQLGVSKQFVSQVLKGERRSADVLHLAAIHDELRKRDDLRKSLKLFPKKKLLDMLMQLMP